MSVSTPTVGGLAMACLIVGVAMVFAGTVGSVLSRQAGVTLAQLLRSGSALAAHPERYVRAERVGVIRIAYVLRVLMWLAGVGMALFAAVAGPGE